MVDLQNFDKHNIVLNNRNSITVQGITAVNGFNDEHIYVLTISDDLLYIEGHEISIKEVNLEKGFVEATGIISGIFYEDKKLNQKKKPGFIMGLFGRE